MNVLAQKLRNIVKIDGTTAAATTITITITTSPSARRSRCISARTAQGSATAVVSGARWRPLLSQNLPLGNYASARHIAATVSLLPRL